MKRIFSIIVICTLFYQSANAQGCVAIRSAGGAACSMMDLMKNIDSEGFRRPGRVLTAEPGVTYAFKKINVYAYLPVALVPNRTQSVPDKIKTEMTGVYTQGGAAFADYSVNIGFA